MPIFERGTIIRVPFPYTNRDVRQHRPALVVSAPTTGDEGLLVWVLMITSARNRPWPGDIAIVDLAGTGLPMPSVVRTSKIATAELSDAQIRGRVSSGTLKAVDDEISRTLGWS